MIFPDGEKLEENEMDSESFRECGKTVVDYIANYVDNIRDRLGHLGNRAVYTVMLLKKNIKNITTIISFQTSSVDCETGLLIRTDSTRSARERRRLEDGAGRRGKDHHAGYHPLELTSVPRLLPHRKLVPVNCRRHAVERDRMHRFFVGTLCVKYDGQNAGLPSNTILTRGVDRLVKLTTR